MPESSPRNTPRAFKVVDIQIVNPALIDAHRWMHTFADAWRNLHPDQADADPVGFAIWAPVMFRGRGSEDPVEVASSVDLPGCFFDKAFLKKARAWTYSFQESWMANEIDPEDVDVRAIDWIWAPCMYAERGNADPIELAKQVQIPDDLFGMIFWGYTRYDPNADAP